MDKKRKYLLIAAAMSAYIQAPVIFVCTAGLCIAAAKYLIYKFNLPDFVMIIGIVLGVLSGMYGMFKHLLSSSRTFDDKEDDNAK